MNEKAEIKILTIDITFNETSLNINIIKNSKFNSFNANIFKTSSNLHSTPTIKLNNEKQIE